MKQEEPKNRVWTKNMFLESCHDLNLSLAQDLTENIIIEAYQKFVKKHLEFTTNSSQLNFNIEDKNKAKVYLLNSITEVRT